MDAEKRLLEIKDSEKILRKKLDEKNKKFDFAKAKSFDEWERFQEPEVSKLASLSRERRMLMSYVLSDLPKYGDVMSLKDFVENVRDGGFIDYDGFGNYVKDGKETDIAIYPSDVRYGSIRTDFDTMVWYNR